MRTRLDEIVEEVARERGADLSIGYGRMDGMIVAERAFRHGVEQGLGHLRKATDHGLTFAQVLVEPAPAEEKCGCGHTRHDGRYCPGCDKQCYSGAWHNDRRKVERRKERRGSVDTTTGRLVYLRGTRDYLDMVDFSGGYFLDRRSGKDRRKK